MTVPPDPLMVEFDSVERQLVEWKRRAKRYGARGMKTPEHVERRIEMLKGDLILLRDQISQKED